MIRVASAIGMPGKFFMRILPSIEDRYDVGKIAARQFVCDPKFSVCRFGCREVQPFDRYFLIGLPKTDKYRTESTCLAKLAIRVISPCTSWQLDCSHHSRVVRKYNPNALDLNYALPTEVSSGSLRASFRADHSSSRNSKAVNRSQFSVAAIRTSNKNPAPI
jgi:hypothetical protein